MLPMELPPLHPPPQPLALLHDSWSLKDMDRAAQWVLWVIGEGNCRAQPQMSQFYYLYNLAEYEGWCSF